MRLSRATEDADGDVLNAGTDLVLTLFGVMTCLFTCVAGKELTTRKQLHKISSATSSFEQDLKAEQERHKALQQQHALAVRELEAATSKIATLQRENDRLKNSEEKLLVQVRKREESETDENQVRLDLVDIRGDLNRVAILVDRSTSMLRHGKYTAADGVPKERIGQSKEDPAKWDDVRRVVKDWINYLPMRESVLVMFSGKVSVFPKDRSWRVMTPENRDAAIRDLYADENYPSGATDTLEALKTAFRYPGLETIILFTDGRPDVDGKTSAEFMVEIHSFVATENAARQSKGGRLVTINTVALGEFDVRQSDDPEGDLPMLSFLIKLAEDTKGAFTARRPLPQKSTSLDSQQIQRSRLPLRKTSP